MNRKDYEQYNKFEPIYYKDVNYRDKMEIDPDNQLSDESKEEVEKILLRFNHLFRP